MHFLFLPFRLIATLQGTFYKATKFKLMTGGSTRNVMKLYGKKSVVSMRYVTGIEF